MPKNTEQGEKRRVMVEKSVCMPEGVCVCLRDEIHLNSLHNRTWLINQGLNKEEQREREQTGGNKRGIGLVRAATVPPDGQN